MVQSWFDTQTGGAHSVFARDGDSISVVTFNLPATWEEVRTGIEVEIRATLPATVGQPLVLYVEGELLYPMGACASANELVVRIPMDNCGIRPLQGSVWPQNAPYVLAHELTHLLGAVPSCAPNFYFAHVIDDRRDVLYSGPGGRDWDNLMLDPGNDDYYNHGRSDCPDIADSPLLGTD